MEDTPYWNNLLKTGAFRFERLALKDIDNAPVVMAYTPDILDQETCLFYRNVLTGDDYFDNLHSTISERISKRKAAPVVRFADGEYAFYNFDLGCNGLYRQAESIDSIKEALSIHIESLKTLAQSGIFAPLIFPGNTSREAQRFFSFFRRSKKKSSASTFLEFLYHNEIELNAENYIPFYVVYAYLTSDDFIRLVNQRKICILNSEFNRNSCLQWFERLSAQPDLSFVEIPAEYIATRWESMKDGILKQIPSDTDICLVGAGIGALMVCVDVAKRFSIPAIDAGHVLNMMNDRVDKSNGARLYTIRKKKLQTDNNQF